MPTLDLDKSADHKIPTLGDVLERLKKDPNDPDPETQAFKELTEKLYGSLIFPTEEAKKIILDARETHFAEILKSIKPTLDLHSLIVTSAKLDISEVVASISKMQIDFNKLSLPSKAIIESIARVQAPLIYPVLSQNNGLDFFPYFYNKEKVRVKPIPIRTYEEEFIEEQETISKEIVRLKEKEPQLKKGFFVFDKETSTLVIKTENWKALNLSTERGQHSMSIFFSTLFDILDESGEKVGQFLQVTIHSSKFAKRLKTNGILDVTSMWIKNTKSNLNKKIKMSNLDNLLIITPQERGTDSFQFKIRLPIQI